MQNIPSTGEYFTTRILQSFTKIRKAPPGQVVINSDVRSPGAEQLLYQVRTYKARATNHQERVALYWQ